MRRAALLFVIFSAVSVCSGDIIYVDCDAPGANDGTSWENAYTDLQLALSDAVSGDEIWVAAGTYKPTSGTDPGIYFPMKDGVDIYGGFAGAESSLEQRNWSANETILSGDIGVIDSNSDNSFNVICGADDARLDGFTVSGAYAGAAMYNHSCNLTVANCTFKNNSSYTGGAVYNNGSNPTVINCVFTGNSGEIGSGILNEGSSPTIINCSFCGNTAGFSGGGIHNSFYSSPVITNCTFSNNSVTSTYLDSGGGAIYSEIYSRPVITGCTFSSNWAVVSGGAIYNTHDCNTVITDCNFTGNWVINRGGGAIYNDDNSKLTITDCMFLDNSADSGVGGAVSNINSNLTMERCILYNNSVGELYFGGAVYNHQADATFNDCKFIHNQAYFGAAIENDDCGNITVTNCVFSRNYDGSAIYHSSSGYLTVENCSFNRMYIGSPGGIKSDGGSLIVKNSIFWDNEENGGSQIYASDFHETISITYCDVQGGWPGEGNIDVDPLYADWAEYDLHLKSQAGRWQGGTESWVTDTNTSRVLMRATGQHQLALSRFLTAEG